MNHRALDQGRDLRGSAGPQGTLYPDVIERMRREMESTSPPATIKTHHNRTGLPPNTKIIQGIYGWARFSGYLPRPTGSSPSG